jgi:uncharacterized membrane protein YedE/YeeE
MRNLLATLSGLIFGLGLIASGMTNPYKVRSFLDITGNWDPSLALVMGGAIATTSLAFFAARRRTHAFSGDALEWPSKTGIDVRLLVGGALFGVGWGLAGFCPGPAIVAMGAGLQDAWIFGAAMLVGFIAHDKLLA